MSVDPDTISKGLRLLPDFDGNPNVLARFIKLCDQLVEAYGSADNNLNNLCLINGILNKISGPAARTINSNGIPDTWDGIKAVLINNFTDQRDETTLYNELAFQSQGSSTPQEFYDKCQTLFSTIMTYITLHEDIETTITAKRTLYKKLTMQAFIRGLKEPLGSRIRCMRPSSIETALEYVQEELNTMYLQQRNDSLPKRVEHNASNYRPPVHTPMPNNYVPKPFAFASNNMQGPSHPPRFNTHAGFQTPQFAPQNQTRMPTRTQQMFGARPPNYNPQSNVFRLPPRPAFNNHVPKPMSGVSHFAPRVLPPTTHDWSRHGNPPPTNYFKTRDVNVNECTPYDDYYNYPGDYYSYSDSYYTDDPRDADGFDYDSYFTHQSEIPTQAPPELCYTRTEIQEESVESSRSSNDESQNFHKAHTSKTLK